jgi:DNA polymerase III delta subunit
MARKRESAPPPLDLAARIRERGLEPLYVLEGPETFLRRRALDALLAASKGEEIALDGAKASLAEVLDEVRTLPFLAAARIVHVPDAELFIAREAEGLERFVASQKASASPAKNALVFSSDHLDGRFQITKRVREAAVTVACETPDEAGLLRFARERARERGCEFARGADGALLERFAGGAGVSVDLGILDAEVAKLCVTGSKEIGVEQVLALASSLTAEDTFAVVGAVGRGDLRVALEALRAVFRDGAIVDGARKREPKALAPILLGLLGWDLGRLFKARALLRDGATAQTVIAECKAWRDRDGFLSRARAATDESLRRQHELLREADALVKDNGDPFEVLTTVVSRLTLLARAGARSPRLATR